MKINWKVRLKNKTFWITAIPALAIMVSSILAVFGVELDLSELVKSLLSVVGAVFSFLAVLGVVADPTTAGLEDSDRAMAYDKPHEDPVISTVDDP